MYLNKNKIIKISNSSAPKPLNNLVNPSPRKKMFNKLNYDCLVKVLTYVPVLERLEMENVCQEWKEAVDWSWHSVKSLDLNDLMIPLDKKEETSRKILTRCCKYLTHLKIIKNHQQYPWMADILHGNCQNIIHFSIDMEDNINAYKIPNKNLIEIIKSMMKLKYVKLSINFEVSNDFCNEISAALPNDIEEIHLTASNPRNKMPCVHFNKNSPVLDKFSGLHCLTLQGFLLTNSTLKSILKNKKTLVKLDLSKCEFPPRNLIFKNLKNLESLILWDISGLNVKEILSIAHNCLKLQHFEFNHGKEVPYSIYHKLKQLNLTHFKFHNPETCNNYFKNKILSENWKELKHLNVNEGFNFCRLDIEEITKFKFLEFLNIYSTKLDSESFIKIANNCLELKELLTGFEHLPEVSLEKLKDLKKLEKLSLHFCNNLTGDLLSKIVNNCGNLVELSLLGCRNLTEDSLIKVGKLKFLKKLNIDYVDNVPNVMFDDLCKLEYLSCVHCSSVTDEGVVKVIDNCKQLGYLNVKNSGVTLETLVYASKREFVFKSLVIFVNFYVRSNYYRETKGVLCPWLEIQC